MSDQLQDIDEPADDPVRETSGEEAPASGKPTGKFAKLTGNTSLSRHKLTGMYMDWFLDYASYVILERAVPHLEDGLKPVQRRLLHAMKRMDDGRYNKVANIIGNTMQYHPHGDASIGDALVQLGQKDLLVDCQGNWGNILTGDGAAAPRYIEARLTRFALDVVFNPKTTEWMLSYDGRNQEPVTLPVKFPLLLAQGVEGIAVGLASKILPHNFNELIEASIACLQGRPFELYPDFPTGGMIDVGRYNDGLRGGAVKVRARINKVDKKTLVITEIPYGKTTSSLIESIIRASEKNKIKIKRVDDNTAAAVEIVVHLAADVSADKTIDALYAFTDCEVSVSPNACIINEDKPHFIGVSDILRCSVDYTKALLKQELEIRAHELAEEWHAASLERIFIENKLYQLIEGKTTREAAYAAIAGGLEPFAHLLRRAVTEGDIVRLTELRFIRISRYDSARADEQIRGIEAEMKQVAGDLAHLVDYTIAHYERIRDRHGKGRERRTEIRGFDRVEAAKVAVNNAKLYVNRAEGFFGIGGAMKKEEYVCECSDIDDLIVVNKAGKYIITKVSEKAFFSRDILWIGVFRRSDSRTIYNAVYRDGKAGPIYMKRCAITGITRDREYELTKGTPQSEVLYLSVNPNGEAEVLKVYFKPRPKLKKLIVNLDFSELAIKGRASQGNLFSRYGIHKIVLKERGASTLGGQNIWFDEDVRRLNADGRGKLLGEFAGEDKLIVFFDGGQYYTTGFDLGQHFPEDTMFVKRYDPAKVYTVTYWDAAQKYFYIKRFQAEATDRPQLFIDESPGSHLVGITGTAGARLIVVFGGEAAGRPPETIDPEEFIGVKSHRAKGKRITTYPVDRLEFLKPEPVPEPEPEEEEPADDPSEDTDELPDDEGGDTQMALF